MESSQVIVLLTKYYILEVKEPSQPQLLVASLSVDLVVPGAGSLICFEILLVCKKI